MSMKRYTIVLNSEVVEEAKDIMNDSGRKLSPVVDNLLRDWIKEMKRVEKLLEEDNQ